MTVNVTNGELGLPDESVLRNVMLPSNRRQLNFIPTYSREEFVMSTWIYILEGALLLVFVGLLIRPSHHDSDDDGYLDPTAPVPPDSTNADDSDLTQDDPALTQPWQK